MNAAAQLPRSGRFEWVPESTRGAATDLPGTTMASFDTGSAGLHVVDDADHSIPAARARQLDDSTVFGRTTLGQREVIFSHRDLTSLQRRFLLMVNGRTSLRYLLDLLAMNDECASDSILQLVDQGLLEVCRPEDMSRFPRHR